MKRSTFVFILLLCSMVAQGQLLSVTATLTDPDGTVWVNGNCTVQIYSPSGLPYYTTTPVPTAPQPCTVNGSGVLAASLYNTSTITPFGAQYRFSIGSATSAQASTFLTPVTAADMTSTLSALLIAPRFDATRAYAYGYVDAEALGTQPGAQYYKTTGTPGLRVYNGSTWGSAGGSSSTGVVNTLQASDGAGGFKTGSGNGTWNGDITIAGSVSANANLGAGGALFLVGAGSNTANFYAATVITSATAGAASALPATPAGYLNIIVNAVNVKVPYYN